MDRSQSTADNGRADRAQAPRPRGAARAPDGEAGLGDVAKDAIDHLREVVSDSVALAKLEARRAVGRVEQTTREIGLRVAVGAAAGVLGLAGVVLGLIAIFMALGEVIPSVAVRLGIYAAVFLVLAAIGGFTAQRGVKAAAPRSALGYGRGRRAHVSDVKELEAPARTSADRALPGR